MNRTFKRAISSILAFVMVMSCVMVMNVSTALAAEKVWGEKVEYNISSDNFTINDKIGGSSNMFENEYGYSIYDDGNDTVTAATVTTITNLGKTAIGFNKDIQLTKYLLSGGGRTYTVEAPNGSMVGIYFVIGGSGGFTGKSAKTLKIDGTENSEVKTANTQGEVYYYESEVVSNNKITFQSNGDRLHPFAFVIVPDATPKSEGKIIINPAQNGSIEVTYEGEQGSVKVSNNETLPGGTICTITLTPDVNYYAKSVSVNKQNLVINDNKVSFTVDGDQTIEAEFAKEVKSTPITQPIILSGHNLNASNKDILEGGVHAEEGTIYHFSLYNDANVKYSGTYLQVSAHGKGINFSTGDLSEKPLNLEVIYGHTNENRGPVLLSSSTEGNEEKTATYGEKTVANEKASTGKIKLESNTDYKISSNNSNIFIYDIIITKDGDNTGVGYTATAGEETTKYVVFKVNNSDMTSSSFDIAKTDGSDDSLISKENTVYESIKFDSDETKTKDDFEADYVVAYKVLDAAANINDEALGAKYKIIFNK